ncbi:hypothetical protein [Frigoriflavimonas asaccharolytica]|uniref:Uncharacterized protein n=1 Tax=Frigoriflavimonas asaccharolytica TaxID=2735899 RepID=A0A8J8G7J6_9FLAO|nr:hypothetical protein [Frigoriflavimonas asaccharolytica]NRS91407.1 hypothetical protein [Frigoriflavimonas asaccharolytica]
MKNLYLIFLLLLSTMVFAQKKTGKKLPPPPPPEPPAVIEYSEEYKTLLQEDSNKCFVLKEEEKKESLIHYTETLIESGWPSKNARIIKTTSTADPVKVEEAEKKGYLIMNTQTMQFIEGVSTLEKNILTFTPEKKDRFSTEVFKIFYKPKSKKVNYLENAKHQKFIEGKCLEPTVSM